MPGSKKKSSPKNDASDLASLGMEDDIEDLSHEKDLEEAEKALNSAKQFADLEFDNVELDEGDLNDEDLLGDLKEIGWESDEEEEKNAEKDKASKPKAENKPPAKPLPKPAPKSTEADELALLDDSDKEEGKGDHNDEEVEQVNIADEFALLLLSAVVQQMAEVQRRIKYFVTKAAAAKKVII